MKSIYYKKFDFKTSLFIGLLALLISFYSCSSDESNPTNNTNPDPTGQNPDPAPTTPGAEPNLPTATVDPNMPGIGAAQNISPFDFVADMGAGWNLGNHFDVPHRDKDRWGNPEPSKEIIDKVNEAGFKTIRIPVTWRTHQGDTEPYQIEESYLQRVKATIDICLANDMKVMLNTHHDTDVFQPIANTEETTSKRLRSTWLQIATYFKAYDENLIFEMLNEPRVQGNNEEWNAGNTTTRGVLNNLHKVAVDAVRSTGGNNAVRNLVISTWAGKTNNTAMNALTIPNNDPNIIITVHPYTPFDVAHDATRPWNGQTDLNQLRSTLDNVKRKWITENNRPVILGEWAMLNNNNVTGRSTTAQQRIEYSQIYVKEATERGLVTVLWDDGGWYRLLNRNTVEWESPGQVEAIINNASN